MKSLFKKQGFSIIELLVIIIVVGLIGVVGYFFYGNFISNNQVKEQSPVASGVPVAPAITTTANLDEAEVVLNGINLDDNTDELQIDSELSNF